MQAGICFLVSIEWWSSPVRLITSIIAGWRELASGRSWWSLAPPGCGALRCRRIEAVRRGKGLSGLVGRVPTPLEEGGSNDPLTFVRKD